MRRADRQIVVDREIAQRLVPADQVDDIVDGIAALIDGFFWQNAGEYEEEDLERARRICWRYVCLQIPGIEL